MAPAPHPIQGLNASFGTQGREASAVANRHSASVHDRGGDRSDIDVGHQMREHPRNSGLEHASPLLRNQHRVCGLLCTFRNQICRPAVLPGDWAMPLERGPAYLNPERTQEPTDAVLITKERGSVLEAGFPWMLPHLMADVDIGPVTAAVVNGSAVSICYCARLSPLGAEAGVETLDGMRG